jgi:hypothetical protein
LQKPVNTVSALYETHVSGQERAFSPDPAQRRSPDGGPSGAQSGNVTRGDMTRARGTPVTQTIAAFKSSDDSVDAASQRKGRKTGSLNALGFTPNLTKLLTFSMPPQTPTGSWLYKDFEAKSVDTARTNRDVPRFDPERFMDFASGGGDNARKKQVLPHVQGQGKQVADQTSEVAHRDVHGLSRTSSPAATHSMQYDLMRTESADTLVKSMNSTDARHKLPFSNFGSTRVPVPTTPSAPGERVTKRIETGVPRLEISGPFSERGRPQTGKCVFVNVT